MNPAAENRGQVLAASGESHFSLKEVLLGLAIFLLETLHLSPISKTPILTLYSDFSFGNPH